MKIENMAELLRSKLKDESSTISVGAAIAIAVVVVPVCALLLLFDLV